MKEVKEVEFAPSILSADFSNLEREIAAVEGSRFLHLDIMDGNFVPNITFGPRLVSSLRDKTDSIFDTHLMIDSPEQYIKDFVRAGSDIITVHAEATPHLHRVVQQIKEQGVKAGVSLNPATPLSELDFVISEVDLVLIMTVNPGFGGQKLIPQTLDKVRQLRHRIETEGLELRLEIDGGVKLDNLDRFIRAGADLIVSGSSIFGADNPSQALAEFQEKGRAVQQAMSGEDT